MTIISREFEVLESQNDEEGRMLLLVVQNKVEKFLVVNVYCPNNHSKSLEFINNVYINILEVLNNHPDCYIVIGGDFNSCLTEKDYLNRNRTQIEVELTKLITQNNEICELTDSYRLLNKDPGYTWNRGECYSRLDYIYISNSLNNRIKCSKTNWGFEKSDHAALVTTLKINPEIKKGPGIIKVNSEVIKDPIKKEQIRDELTFLLSQIPNEWDGHMKLDFLKISLRSTIAKYTSIKRQEDKEELENLEGALNDTEILKMKVVTKIASDQNNSVLRTNLNKIEIARNSIKHELEVSRNKVTERLSFKANAHWYEYGEKSNKFFLNLNKVKSRQKLISTIKNGDKIWEGQAEVTDGIREFYSDLYKKNTNLQPQSSDPGFFDHCPKLSEVQKNSLDVALSLDEMRKALFSCKESAPGPDGIPYIVYKVFWPQVGQIIKDAWDYSIESGKIPNDHKQSIITIIPKEGKDISDIKNWRPITLSNCDAKIITKSLSNRLKPILEHVIDPTQTAYVPGRSVMDNLRSNMFVKNYCKKNSINAILTSLDAQKAFDSVDHNYIDCVLEKYGFGENFRWYFKILYRDLSAKILVNGYFSEQINIERGVKQGDALSCAIFILCIDPLLRNINKNEKIKPVTIVCNRTKTMVNHKACGFADDISVACLN
jgi:hypothetical protein